MRSVEWTTAVFNFSALAIDKPSTSYRRAYRLSYCCTRLLQNFLSRFCCYQRCLMIKNPGNSSSSSFICYAVLSVRQNWKVHILHSQTQHSLRNKSWNANLLHSLTATVRLLQFVCQRLTDRVWRNQWLCLSVMSDWLHFCSTHTNNFVCVSCLTDFCL